MSTQSWKNRPDSHVVRVTEETYRNLEVLRLTWRKPNLNSVLVELIKPHMLDIFSILPIEVEESNEAEIKNK